MMRLQKSSDTNRVNILNQLAWEYRNNNIQLCDSFSKEAIQLSTKLDYDKGIGQGYVCLALIERNQGNYIASIDKARWALLHFVKSNYLLGYSSAYNTIASVHHIQGRRAIALFYYLQALTIAENLGDKKGVARTYNNLGVIYMDMGDYKKSLHYFHKVLQILYQLNDHNGIADALNNIGSVYSHLKDSNKSIYYYLQSIKYNEQNQDMKNVFAGFNNIGSVYTDMGDYKNALNYYFQALRTNEKIGDVQSTIICYNNIAVTYNKLKMQHAALKYVNEALELSLKHNLKDEISFAYELLYQIEVDNKNFKEALNYHELYKAYSDSIVQSETTERITYLEQIYEKEKQEKEHILKGHNDEINYLVHSEKEKRIKQYILLIGLVLAIFVIVIYLTFFVLKWRRADP